MGDPAAPQLPASPAPILTRGLEWGVKCQIRGKTRFLKKEQKKPWMEQAQGAMLVSSFSLLMPPSPEHGVA